MATTRKVLMLHGYAQSATIFSKRMGALRKTCGKDVELVFVDAPYVLTPVDMAYLSTLSNNSSLEDLGAPEAVKEQDPALAPRGWWKAEADRNLARGLDDSLAALRDILAKDHYEGVFGFSQGAAMAAILAALLERPQAHPPFLIDGKPPHPPLGFCIAVAGFRPRSPLADTIFSPSYSTPTLHVLGRTDVIVVEERSKTLIDISDNKRVVHHDGGHFVPSKAPWRNFLRSYMKDPLGDIPAPGPAAASQNASGISTPITPENGTENAS
ncbi:FSH1-domain-containing protein [Laetiporus sulphureus 93-53]|uniref:FSH1-domain-containing protein n=1 Tax=Laetiporus sulphureus 93-53 TaxID=1314785 RepID=A0A165DQ70_9APHY|nr:FSH1-domain-containing protein [Laetiporus sulphureus 93-53]KZT05383.1 FSH1-domain-containing protein [Laetiporus sulphureus 93-53]